MHVPETMNYIAIMNSLPCQEHTVLLQCYTNQTHTLSQIEHYLLMLPRIPKVLEHNRLSNHLCLFDHE